jgi:hypothetical protein
MELTNNELETRIRVLNESVNELKEIIKALQTKLATNEIVLVIDSKLKAIEDRLATIESDINLLQG